MLAKAQDPANLFVCRSLESLGWQMTETSVLEHLRNHERVTKWYKYQKVLQWGVNASCPPVEKLV